MLRVSEAELQRAAGVNALVAGKAYYRQARVVAFSRDGDDIRSRVAGSGRRPYEQVITLRLGERGVHVAGSCTCPVGRNCKHVVAALLHAETIARAQSGGLSSNDGGAILPGAPRAEAPPPPPDLPPHIEAWLDGLARAATASEDYPETVRHRLVYVLKPLVEGSRLPMLGVQVLSARLDKAGGWTASSQPYVGANTPREQRHAEFVRPSDLAILRLLGRVRHLAFEKMSALGDETGAEILAKMIETGRLRWLALDGPALRAGEPRTGRIVWQSADATTLAPRIETDHGAEVLAGTPPVYVDPGLGIVGALDTGHPAAIAAALSQAPPIPALAVEALHRRLASKAPTLAALAPPIPKGERLAAVDPVPVLRLTRIRVALSAGLIRYDAAIGGYRTHEELAVGLPAFRYGPLDIPVSECQPTVTRYVAGRLLTIERRPDAEAAALATLRAHEFRSLGEVRPGTPAEHAHAVVPDGDALAWYDALYHVVPSLKAAGFAIDVAADFPIDLVRADGAFDVEIAEGSGIDWLELHLGVAVDGERIDLVGPLVAMISAPDFSMEAFDLLAEDEEDPVYVALPDGRTLAIPFGRLRPLVSAIHDLALGTGAGDGRLRLSRFDAAMLAEFEAASAGAMLAWRGGEAIRALGRKLAAHGGVPPVAIPPSFRAALRPYQAEGVAWLAMLREIGLGGILADDMGLGKTVQALALVAIEKAEGRLDRPALVVAPMSLMANWRREAERFAPDLRVLTLHGLGRKALFDSIPEHDLVLTTYPLVARDHAALMAIGWHVLLLDEAQTIKNPDATTTRLVATIAARHRFCLTGTPLENNLGELWSLFAFACPGLLGERKRFNAVWRNPIEKAGDGERGRLLARRVRPFLLRRTKEEVARDLPPKTEIVERIELPPAQRDIYESIRLSMHRKVQDALAEKGWARSRIIILDALLKLRQACCDPRLLKLKSKPSAGSAKLERLEEMLAELLAAGRRVIVFSQFTSMLDLIRPRLDAAGIGYALLTGQTRDRPAALAAFQSGAVPVFLISLKAGGTGLNLVEADTVVLYDPWWNPAVEAQAIDRAHRIGQTKPVFVHKLVAVGTIEEKMEVLKERKGALAASLFDHDGEPTLAMTEADIEMLLGA